MPEYEFLPSLFVVETDSVKKRWQNSDDLRQNHFDRTFKMAQPRRNHLCSPIAIPAHEVIQVN